MELHGDSLWFVVEPTLRTDRERFYKAYRWPSKLVHVPSHARRHAISIYEGAVLNRHPNVAIVDSSRESLIDDGLLLFCRSTPL